MKTLYFQDETNYFLYTKPTIISSTFMNNAGEKIYIALHRGTEKNKRTISKSGKELKKPVIETLENAIVCHFCSQILTDGEDGEDERILPCQRKKTGKEFTLENILQFVNENCNCNFDEVVILNKESSYESSSVDWIGYVTFNPMEHYDPKIDKNRKEGSNEITN